MADVEMHWDDSHARRAAQDGAAHGLTLGTEHLLGVSRNRAPIEEGTLERSGEASVDASALKGAVSYNTPYAVRQHEELDWQHDPGRTAKYLEGPLAEEADTIQDLVAAAIRRELR